MFRALCAYHQEVKIVLYSIWFNHTYRWPSGIRALSWLITKIKATLKFDVPFLERGLALEQIQLVEK